MAPAAPFDPTQSRHTWRVAATDYAESAILLPILASLRRQAPGSRLAVLELAPTRIVRQAERGEIDLAFHTSKKRRRDCAVAGCSASAMCWPGAPGIGAASATDAEAVLPPRAGDRLARRRRLGPTDQALAELGAERRVALSVPHFLFLRAVLESTDLVALLPSRLVRERDRLRVVEAPLEVPGYDLAMLWHERSHRDPAHRWLRELIAASV